MCSNCFEMRVEMESNERKSECDEKELQRWMLWEDKKKGEI